MSLPANPDTATITQWLAAIASANSQDGRVSIKEFVRRFGVVPALGITGLNNDPLGPIGLGVRSEWLSLVRAGRAFASGQILAASVGNRNVHQLFNPGGSGVRVLVYQALAHAAALMEWFAGFDTAAAATDSGGGRSLLNNAGAGLAHLRQAQPAANPGTLTTVLDFFTQISTTRELVSTPWLAELAEGEGFDLVTQTVNTLSSVSFLYAEVPATYP